MLNLLLELLHETFLVFLVGGCVVGLVAGGGMLINPNGVLRLNRYFNQWFSTDKAMDVLDRQHQIERVMYRYHRLTGALILAGGVYTLYMLNFVLNQKTTVAILSDRKNYYLVEWLLEATVLAFNTGSVIALAVGVVLLIRPSLLKGLESTVNRWVSSEKPLQTLDTMRYRLDHFIAAHIRVVGVLVMVGSIYVISILKNFI